MTLNGVTTVILRYFAEFVLYRAPTLGKSWQRPYFLPILEGPQELVVSIVFNYLSSQYSFLAVSTVLTLLSRASVPIITVRCKMRLMSAFQRRAVY